MTRSGTDLPAVETVAANGLRLAWERFGDPVDPPVLLVSGLGGQLVSWRVEFCQALVARGYQVVRFDNRDVGLTTHLTGAGVPDLVADAGNPAAAPYVVEDMADDTAALLDALALAPAHVVGVSMGGMIVQSLAIRHPGHVRSLTSIMSTPSTTAARPTDEALAALMVTPAEGRAAVIEQSVEVSRVLSSPAYPFDEPWARTNATVSYDRDPDRDGRARQLAAILASPDRTPGLAEVRVPTLIVHGSADPLIPLAGGRATAAAVPGAELHIEEGMGHELPTAVWDRVLDRIDAVARRADARPR
jgi:pimeloyl-ACP methyl ester carboxylesterase